MARKPVHVIHDRWDTYVAESREGPVFVSFDVEAAQEDLTDTLRHCARVLIPIKKPNRNGGPVPPESDRLYEMEEDLCAALADEGVVCRQVGRITCAGMREVVFQLDDWDTFRPPVGRWMAGHRDYEVDVSEHEGWEFFDDCIRPTPDIWLMMADRRVVRGLREAGSDPEKEHALEFFFSGPERGLRQLARALGAKGYTPLGAADYGSGKMGMVKRMPLDEGEIIEESRANRDLAEGMGLGYDGWGAAVVR